MIQKEPHAPRIDDPTGEPESLYGRIDPKQMGILAAREKPRKPQVNQDPSKAKKKQTDTIFNPKKKTKIVRVFIFFLFLPFILNNINHLQKIGEVQTFLSGNLSPFLNFFFLHRT